MSSPTVLVRTKLTPEEWRQFKSLAALKGINVSDFAADALRAVLKGAKP
jgi:hypothetical protein